LVYQIGLSTLEDKISGSEGRIFVIAQQDSLWQFFDTSSSNTKANKRGKEEIKRT
jgi:hypothetical protein